MDDAFSRVGFCQIHQDVWDSFEKVQRMVVLERKMVNKIHPFKKEKAEAAVASSF